MFLLDGQTSIAQLKARAIMDNSIQSMEDWVQSIFIEPVRPKISYRYASQHSLRENEIGLYELKYIGYLWDREGYTTPLEFVNAVECETVGTQKHRFVQEALNDFGVETNIEVDEEVTGYWWEKAA